jgi:hypothetical protein
MKASTYLHWVGWSVILSAISMILSMGFNILAYAAGSITFGTHTHSVIVETFDVLTTGFLLPLPLGFYMVYKNYAPRLSYLSTLIGTITFLAVTILHVLFVVEVLWFSDPISKYLYGVIGIGFISWLVMIAVLARRSRKPAHGSLINIIGATIVGFPIWAFSTGYLLLAGKLTDQSA